MGSASRRFGLLLVCLTSTLAADTGLQRFHFTAHHMGTSAQVVFYAESNLVAKLAAEAVFQRIGDLEGLLSDYVAASELRQLTAAESPAYTRWMHVSEDLFLVLESAASLSAESNGAFDVSIGPVSRLWRRARRTGQPPSESRLADAKRSVGYRAVQFDRDRQAVRLLNPGMRFDLGGIAKGYAADQALRVLLERGIARAFVDLGGDLALGAAPPDREGWAIRLAPLGAAADGVTDLPVLELSHCGVATSGDAAQSLVVDGERLSHIIDPRTGQPVTDGWAVTVVAGSGMWADALASAAAVMGPEASQLLMDDHKAAACFAKPGKHRPQVRKTASFLSLPLRTGK